MTVRSPAVELGIALLHERCDTFGEVIGAQQRQQLQEHMVHVLLERLGFGSSHHALDRPHGERCVGRDLLRHGGGALDEFVCVDDMVHQTEIERLGGREGASGERDLGSLGVADHPRQQPGATALGQDAPLRETGVELGGVDGDADVAAQRQVESVAGRAAVQGADRGGVEVVQHHRWGATQIELAAEGHVAASTATQVAQTSLRSGHLRLQVEPGTEGTPSAGEHDAAHVGIVIGAQ